MKLTLTIETQDPAELSRVAQALSGINTAPVQEEKSKAAPRAAAPTTAPTTAPAAAPTAAPAAAPTAAPAAAPSAEAPTQNDLTVAVNAACAKLGNGGPAKVKAYIAANFTKADGSPGGLNSTADAQKPALLEALNKIASGAIPL